MYNHTFSGLIRIHLTMTYCQKSKSISLIKMLYGMVSHHSLSCLVVHDELTLVALHLIGSQRKSYPDFELPLEACELSGWK